MNLVDSFKEYLVIISPEIFSWKGLISTEEKSQVRLKCLSFEIEIWFQPQPCDLIEGEIMCSQKILGKYIFIERLKKQIQVKEEFYNETHCLRDLDIGLNSLWKVNFMKKQIFYSNDQRSISKKAKSDKCIPWLLMIFEGN